MSNPPPSSYSVLLIQVPDCMVGWWSSELKRDVTTWRAWRAFRRLLSPRLYPRGAEMT